jgi:hypothetical protein
MLSTMSRCADYLRNFQISAVAMETAKMLKKIEKHKNDHSRLLAKQKLIKLVERDKPKKSESVGQTLSKERKKEKKKEE